MEFPIRCFTCGSVIGHLYKPYLELIKQGKSKKESLDELGIDKYCCRRMFISYVNIMDDIIKYDRKE